MKSGFVNILACAGILVVADSAAAADVYSPVAPETHQLVTEQGWTFSVAPYFWAAGLSGEVGQFGLPPVDVDASFGDIVDHLDFGAMAIGEARYGRYSIFGDIMYSRFRALRGRPEAFWRQTWQYHQRRLRVWLEQATPCLKATPVASMSLPVSECGRSKTTSPSAVAFLMGSRKATARLGWMGWLAFAETIQSRPISI
jgi:hypothetical protein